MHLGTNDTEKCSDKQYWLRLPATGGEIAPTDPEARTYDQMTWRNAPTNNGWQRRPATGRDTLLRTQRHMPADG
ncbi:uncharacterized protein LAESUDRAFT_568454 [Laetiporus sulphureus 93-53]|uniref:Uncharacterized protein n=1 Tax=Laetiporus sulphureus 93-53 TaxID=1314785 RepID=A0A165FHD2_9APHY|nr:uncharacterized protein LAESUDRAFT_568454 [Laetiporus sulphureus 93-53]KZT08973.1 hypothetical protein LAESUDRAFT_568454 [Laetiporus sulphureus 93-53]